MSMIAWVRIYCGLIWAKRIDEVDTTGVLACLMPIWQAKPETASRVRGRIERVLNAAKAERLRTGENPAAWRGHLDATLPKPKKLTRGHHSALPYAEMPAFMTDLRARPALAALALELAVLTATRTSEVRNAKWPEFDLDAGLWTIPSERMKARREHRVPLSKRALAIVKELSEALIFGVGKPQSSAKASGVLRSHDTERGEAKQGVTVRAVSGFDCNQPIESSRIGEPEQLLSAVKLFYETEELKEGVRAFKEKRKPEFHKHVK